MTTWRLQTVQGEERWIVGAEAAEQQRVREQWKKRIVFYSDVRTWHIPLQTAITKYQREATYLSESETSNCKGNKYRLWWAGLRHTDRQWPGTSWSEDSILTLMFCFFLLFFFFFFLIAAIKFWTVSPNGLGLKATLTSAAWEHFGFKFKKRGKSTDFKEPHCEVCLKTVPIKGSKTWIGSLLPYRMNDYISLCQNVIFIKPQVLVRETKSPFY